MVDEHATFRLRPRGDGGAPERITLVVVTPAGKIDHVLARGAECTIGRGEGCDLVVPEPSISRKHARFSYSNDGVLRVEDLDSANGTRIGDRTLAGGDSGEVASGDVVELGALFVVVDRIGLHGAREEAPREASGSAMDGVHALVARVAKSNLSVLLLGETGVGKEVLAERVHRLSPRADAPFLRMNCAALSEQLLESELFGHERGAFTGAVAAKPGLLETADGGTVFLDEVGELPLPLQAKLLRVLEDRKVLRVGALKPKAIDVRFVAATNRDLEAEIAGGRFRQDLYFRLNGISIFIPPLRERVSEIEPLARRFAAAAARAQGRDVEPTFTPRARYALEAYAWPGNVRELKNVVDRAVVLTDADVLDEPDLGLGAGKKAPAPAVDDKKGALKEEVEALEQRRILDVLAACNGNQTRAAKELGISRGTLVARLEKFGVSRPRKKS